MLGVDHVATSWLHGRGTLGQRWRIGLEANPPPVSGVPGNTTLLSLPGGPKAAMKEIRPRPAPLPLPVLPPGMVGTWGAQDVLQMSR